MNELLKKMKSATKGSKDLLNLTNERLLGTGLSVSPASRDKVEEVYDSLSDKKKKMNELNPSGFGKESRMEKHNSKQMFQNMNDFEDNYDAFKDLDKKEMRKFLRYNQQAEV